MKKSLLLCLLILSACGNNNEEAKSTSPTPENTENIIVIEQTGAIELSCDESAGYYSIGNTGFSPDGKDYYFLGLKNGGIDVVKNNEVVYTSTGEDLSLYIDEGGYYTLDRENTYMRDGAFVQKFQKIDDMPELTEKNALFIATDTDGKKYGVLHNDFIPFDSEYIPSSYDRKISGDGKSLAYIKSTLSGSLVAFSGKEYGPYYRVGNIIISPDGTSVAYIAKASGFRDPPGIYLDGNLLSSGDQNYYSPGFTSDNKLYYTISNGDFDSTLILDGKELAKNLRTTVTLHPKTSEPVYGDAEGLIHIGEKIIGKGSNIVFSEDGEHFAYMSGTYGDKSLVKDGGILTTYSANNPAKEYLSDMGCEPKFIGNSLYYLEKRGENTVLVKDGEMVDLGEVTLPNSEDMNCTGFGKNEYRFGYFSGGKGEFRIHISERGDIAYLEKPLETWSIHINKRKINQSFDSVFFDFGKDGSYGILAFSGADRMIIREGGKCISSRYDLRNDNIKSFSGGSPSSGYMKDYFVSPGHSSIQDRTISREGDLFYVYMDLAGSGTSFGYGYLGNEEPLTRSVIENYPLIDLDTPGTIQFRKDYKTSSIDIRGGYTFQKKYDNNGKEWIERDGSGITLKHESIFGELYSASGDVIFIGENDEDTSKGKYDQIFSSLYKNDTKLLDASNMVSDFISNNSGDVLAYIGNIPRRDSTYSLLDDGCTTNTNQLRSKMLNSYDRIPMKQYIVIGDKKYEDFDTYSIAGLYNDSVLWVGCDTTTMKAKLLLSDELVTDDYEFIEHPKMISNYLVFETAYLISDHEGSWIKDGEKGDALIIYDLEKKEGYTYTGTSDGWSFSNHVAGLTKDKIIIEEVSGSGSARMQRIMSISPLKLIQMINE